MLKKKVAAKEVPATKKKAKPAAEAPAKKVVPGKKKVAPARAGAAKKRKVLTFSAPADFKPHFLLVEINTEKDGLIGGNVKATRYQGRFDPQADEKKKFDLGSYDQDTLRAITARLAAITFKTNAERIFPDDPAARAEIKGAHRLPKATTFHALLRIGKRAADNSLTVSIRTIYQRVTKKNAKTGKVGTRSVELPKTDPVSRLIRRAGRIMPAAFQNVLLPPKRTRGSRREEAAEE